MSQFTKSLIVFCCLASTVFGMPALLLLNADAQDYLAEDHGVVGNDTTGDADSDAVGAANVTAIQAILSASPSIRQNIRFRGNTYPMYGSGTLVGTENLMKTLVYTKHTDYGFTMSGKGVGIPDGNAGGTGDGGATEFTWTSASAPASPTAILSLLGVRSILKEMSFFGGESDGAPIDNLVGLAIIKGATGGAGKHSCRDLGFDRLDVGICCGAPLSLGGGEEQGGNMDNLHWGSLHFKRVNTCYQINAISSMEHHFYGGIHAANIRRVIELNAGGNVFVSHLNISGELANGSGDGDGTATMLYLGETGTGSNNGYVRMENLRFDELCGSGGRVVDCDPDVATDPCQIEICGLNVNYDSYDNATPSLRGYLFQLYGRKSLVIVGAKNIQPNTLRLHNDGTARPNVTFIGCQLVGLTTLQDVVDEENSSGLWGDGEYYVRCISCFDSTGGGYLPIADQDNIP